MVVTAKLGRGYDASRITLRENKKLNAEITKEIKKHLESDGLAYAGSADPDEENAPEE